MLKVFNISTLVLFVCFLFAPTITFALEKEPAYSIIINEEEESSSKTNTNNLNEEEEKEVKYCAFENFKNYLPNNPLILGNGEFSKLAMKDDLVFKIPLPPPEHLL